MSVIAYWVEDLLLQGKVYRGSLLIRFVSFRFVSFPAKQRMRARVYRRVHRVQEVRRSDCCWMSSYGGCTTLALQQRFESIVYIYGKTVNNRESILSDQNAVDGDDDEATVL